MGLRPLRNKRLRAARQLSFQNLQRPYIDERFVLRVKRVKWGGA
jgi:hypothetical protein